MRIASITAGAAGMYCGSCMRDNTLAAALQALGHDCVLIPTYTPIRTDEEDVSLNRVYFGGISVYLEQKSALFRQMPRWLDRFLSQPRLLRWVSRFAVKTSADELGPLTISMLQGMDGHQKPELIQLLDWLQTDFRPDVVLLTNVLLSGLVPELKRRLNVPIIATLQGDDIYLEFLSEPFKGQAFELIEQNCRSLDRYIVTSRYYAGFMADYLRLPRERMHIVYPGINLADYPAASEAIRRPEAAGKLTIGYLARICPEKGLHQLVKAVGLLNCVDGAPRCRLRIAGYLPENQKAFLEKQRERAMSQGWGSDFEFVGEVTFRQKVEFLKSLDLFSVPTVYREPKGLYLLEAWACGVPVVQPRHGSFPELVEAANGGLLFSPDNPIALAEGLAKLLTDEAARMEYGRRGREAVHSRFTARRMALDTLAVLEGYRAAR